MRRATFITAIITFLIIFNLANAAYCCMDRKTGQNKCYLDDDGECCGGYWYPSCYGFNVTVSGSNVLRIGQKTPITIYIQNTGAYTDTYDISVTGVSPSISPSQIEIDMSGSNQVTVNPNEVSKVFPQITILSPVTGEITFTIGSSQASFKTVIHSIFESDYYLSLPEFTQFSMLGLTLLIAIIYFIRRQRYLS